MRVPDSNPDWEDTPDGVDDSQVAKAVNPEAERIMRWFTFDHLPPDLQAVSFACYNLAHAMVQRLPRDPETTAGLRKLLEAKDCFVRAAKADEE